MKILLGLVIVLGIILLSACSNKAIDSNTHISGNNFKTGFYDSYINTIKSLNLTGCNNFTGVYRDSCIFSVKVSLGKINNINECKFYKTLNIRENCENYIYKKDYICDKLKSLLEKKTCLDNKYYSKAIEKQDSYWCLYINDSKKKKSCIKNIQQLQEQKSESLNTSICGNNNLFKECKTNKCKAKQLFSLFLSEPSFKEKYKICQQIKKLDKKVGIECLDNFYSQKALYLMDFFLCKNIQNSKIKERCYNEVVLQTAIENTDLDTCNLLKNKDKLIKCKDEVYIRIISRDSLKDSSICKKVVTPFYKKKCYDLILKNL